jgi:transposase
MMGRLKSDQGQLFYEFHLGDAVPEDHLVRKIDAALDLSWLRDELAPHYSSMGRPSIDPELMIRMLVAGYVFAIRSERLICREVQVNLAYRWFCKLGIEDAITNKHLRSKLTLKRPMRWHLQKFQNGSIFQEIGKLGCSCLNTSQLAHDIFPTDVCVCQFALHYYFGSPLQKIVRQPRRRSFLLV